MSAFFKECMMDNFGFPLIIALILIGIPAAVVLGKAGYSRWWAILAFIPVVNLIGLWVFAFSNWPVLRNR